MNDLSGTPPPQPVSRIELIGGWFVVALCLGVGASLVRAMYARPQAVAMWPAALFLLAALLALIGLSVVPTLRLLRDADARARRHAALAMCPSCGAARTVDARCPSCAHPTGDSDAYWVISARHWMEPLATALFGPSLMGLALFFAILMSHAHTSGTLVIFSLFALALLAGGAAILWFSIASLRAVLREPMKFTYTRTWRRDEAFWYTWASAVLRDGQFTAEGRTDGVAKEPPASHDHGAGSPFERGLARLLADWQRDERAPLSSVCSLRWSWAPVAASKASRRESAYRDAVRDGTEVEGITRETRVWWTVSFNRYSLGELLAEAQLPPLTGDPDDARIGEMLDAEWDVNLSDFVEVVSRCAPLRGAIEARGEAGDDGDPVRRALCAVRSPGTPDT
ncbi:MAG: hypothetical protein U0326_38925 [Polyangiales bacterium]